MLSTVPTSDLLHERRSSPQNTFIFYFCDLGNRTRAPPPSPSPCMEFLETPPLRVFFIPYFATGHMIPLVDVARLFAFRGVESTVLVTPANAALVRTTVDSAAASGLTIRLLVYPFPSAESGLPPGVENISALPPSECHKIDAALPFIRQAHGEILRLHHPDAVVSDTHFPWTTAVASDLGIPRITFHALGLFAVSVMNSLFKNLPHLAVSGDDDRFLIPDFPDRIWMTRRELPDFLRGETHTTAILDVIKEGESGSMGVVVNSFVEMESAYADCYLKSTKLKSWFVGPVALAGGDRLAERGGEDRSAAANRDQCLEWLNEQEPRSVTYVCFGSWSQFTNEQLREMALGLEDAGHPFIWVVRESGEGWMPEGYESRIRGKGLVVRGWAPQVAILGHDAVGGFVTHCGWNSVLEGVSAGLPMVTWPLSTEQFINEKLVVEVLRIGVQASGGLRGTEEEEQAVVAAAEVARAVERMMEAGEEAEGRRKRAKEYGEKARAAVQEGGSSRKGADELIAAISAWHESRKQSLVPLV